MKPLKTNNVYFSLRFDITDRATKSRGTQLEVDIDQDGKIAQVWIDSDPIPATMRPDELIEKLVGAEYLVRRANEMLADKETVGFSEEDEMFLYGYWYR